LNLCSSWGSVGGKGWERVRNFGELNVVGGNEEGNFLPWPAFVYIFSPKWVITMVAGVRVGVGGAQKQVAGLCGSVLCN